MSAAAHLETCHGPGSAYLEPHQKKDAYQRPSGSAWSMPSKKPQAWAALCMNCHVMDDTKLIASKHPSGDDFDLGAKFGVVATGHWKSTYGNKAEISALGKAFAQKIHRKRGGAAPVANTAASRAGRTSCRSGGRTAGRSSGAAAPPAAAPTAARAATPAPAAARGPAPAPAAPRPPPAARSTPAAAAAPARPAAPAPPLGLPRRPRRRRRPRRHPKPRPTCRARWRRSARCCRRRPRPRWPRCRARARVDRCAAPARRPRPGARDAAGEKAEYRGPDRPTDIACRTHAVAASRRADSAFFSGGVTRTGARPPRRSSASINASARPCTAATAAAGDVGSIARATPSRSTCRARFRVPPRAAAAARPPAVIQGRSRRSWACGRRGGRGRRPRAGGGRGAAGAGAGPRAAAGAGVAAAEPPSEQRQAARPAPLERPAVRPPERQEVRPARLRRCCHGRGAATFRDDLLRERFAQRGDLSLVAVCRFPVTGRHDAELRAEIEVVARRMLRRDQLRVVHDVAVHAQRGPRLRLLDGIDHAEPDGRLIRILLLMRLQIRAAGSVTGLAGDAPPTSPLTIVAWHFRHELADGSYGSATPTALAKSLVFTASICLSALRWLLGGGPSFFSDHSFSLSWSWQFTHLARPTFVYFCAKADGAAATSTRTRGRWERVWVPCVTAPWGFEGTSSTADAQRALAGPNHAVVDANLDRRVEPGRALSRDEIVLLHTVAAHASPPTSRPFL